MQGLPVRIVITEDSRGIAQAGRLIESINADYLLADKGYDSDALIKQAKDQGGGLVIPPRKTEPNKGLYDEELYKPPSGRKRFPAPEKMARHRHKICQNSKSFLAAVQRSGVSPHGLISRDHSIYYTDCRNCTLKSWERTGRCTAVAAANENTQDALMTAPPTE